MTYAVGGAMGEGVPKKQTKEQNQLICDSDRGGGKKSEPFADVIYGSPGPVGCCRAERRLGDIRSV